MSAAFMDMATFSELLKLMGERHKNLLGYVKVLLKFGILCIPGLAAKEIVGQVTATSLADDSGLIDCALEEIVGFFEKNQCTGRENARIAKFLMIFSAYFDTAKRNLTEELWKKIALSGQEKDWIAQNAAETYSSPEELTIFTSMDGSPQKETELKAFYCRMNEGFRAFLDGLAVWQDMSGDRKDKYAALLRKIPDMATEHYFAQLQALSVKSPDFLVYELYERTDNIGDDTRHTRQMVDEIHQAVVQPATAKAPYTLTPNYSTPEYWVPGSRSEALAFLSGELERNHRVFLWGVGGIGKTETAIKLAENTAENTERKIYLFHYKGNMGDTLLSALLGDATSEKGLSTAERLDRRLNFLGEYREKAVFIVDNFDRDGASLEELQNDEVYQRFCSLGLRLIFTTRCDLGNRPQEIKALAEDELVRLMEYYTPDIEVDKSMLRKLIVAVDRHTLMVTLMAKTLNEGDGDIQPEKLLEALQDYKLQDEDLPEVTTGQQRDGRRNMEADRLYGHLKTLFNLSGMGENERTVLRYAALLSDGGMEQKLFRACLTKEQKTAAKRLKKLGWLSGREGPLKIHPLIRQVCVGELGLTDENCGPFLKELGAQYDQNKTYTPEQLREMAECFARASDWLEDKEGNWAHHGGILFNRLGEYQRALEMDEKALEIRKKALPEDHPDLAQSYNNVGNTYSNIGDYQKALECQQKALEICEKALPADHPRPASSLNNLGSTYGELGDYQKALAYQQRALRIREKVLPEGHPDLARSYNNVGMTQGKLNNHKKALQLQQKALEILEKVLPENHSDLAIAYNNVGGCYSNLDDHEMARDYQLKALKIWKDVLPKDHPDLATAYNNVGMTYDNLGAHQTALNYLLKALKIREKKLQAGHSDLALSYSNMGVVYFHLGNYPQAISNMEKAIAIWEKAFPNGHPNLRTAYRNIVLVCLATGEFGQAIQWLLKLKAITPPQ